MTVDAIYNAKHPYQATISEIRELNGAGSQKDTRHVIIYLGEEGPQYVPGDSLGILPRNNPELVQRVIDWLGAKADESVDLPKGGGTLPLSEALQCLEISKVPKNLLQPLSAHTNDEVLRKLADPTEKELLTAYCDGRDLCDILAVCRPGALSAQELVDGLKPLLPRLYSIASSPRAHPGEVHLTVGVVTWESHGRLREGVASSYLGRRSCSGSKVEVFVHHSKNFGLPEDPATDIIMVGPGTGIAPFRAFLEERRIVGGSGRNWLFFGDQHSATDYLYHEEMASLQQEGILHRVDLAFSRDQGHKVYVQHRMLERGAELWRWIQGGAIFYVCGDALRMAKDVDAALHQVVQEHGGMSHEDAVVFVKQLKKDKRYLRDVYAV
ncbi:MAG: sulfite reductase subunit alpha [Planctomycetota bacterium]|nr:MAG: sulfite reductase subunit alpha [Planctomycetota bacterium]